MGIFFYCFEKLFLPKDWVTLTHFNIKRIFFFSLWCFIFILISSGQPSVAQASNFEFSHEQMEEKFYAPLDGKWYFFQEQLVDPFAAREKIASGEGELIKQPSTFEADTGKVNTYGTYIA